MPTGSELFIPSKRLVHSVRPLNLGVRNDLPSAQMPDGSFKTLTGMIAQPYGLRRIPAVSGYGTWAVDFPPIQGIWTCRAVTGVSFSVLMDRRKVYIINIATLTPLDWKYTTGTVSGTAGSKTITGVGTLWDTTANWILAGDRIKITGDSSTTNETNAGATTIKTYQIASITDDTTLVLEEALPAGFSPSGATYEIYRSVGASAIATPVNVNDKLYFTDGQRPIQQVTSTAWSSLGAATETPTTVTYMPYAISYFNDRLWVGDIDDPHDFFSAGAATRYRQQLRWSDLGIGNLATFNSTSFLNLPYGFGAIRRLLPMSQFLVAYFTDSIWIGQKTNLPDLPLEFSKFETGGMGLITPNAVTGFFDGHFFVGQDDVYYLSSRGVEGVGTPVMKDMLKRVLNRNLVRAATDYSTSTVIFGIPADNDQQISEIWRFNYKAKAWSVEYRDADFIGTDTILETISWDTIETVLNPATWAGFIYYDEWDTILTEAAWNQQLYFSDTDQLYYYRDDSGTTDADTGTSPYVQVMTGDMDMNYPDVDKIWTKFILELEEPLASDDETLEITLEGSVDKGKHWKALGTLSIDADEDESAVNFRITGPALRIRMTAVQGSLQEPYTFGGFGLTFKVMGNETQSRTNQ